MSTPSAEGRDANAFNQYTKIGNPLPSTPNLAYDANGNLPQNNMARAFAWSAFNRLATTSKTGASAARYLYDANGRRVARRVMGASTVDQTVYGYDGWRVIEEREALGVPLDNNTPTDPAHSANGALLVKRQFVFGNYLDEPLTMDLNTTPSGTDVSCIGATDKRYFYLQNTLYSVVGLVDAAGALVEAYDYDPYGAPIRFAPANNQTVITSFSSATQTVFNPATPSTVASLLGNPYLFTGQRFDPETGLHYYKMRYYDCGLGRFVSRDPMGYNGGSNLYGYVMSIPTKGTDPLGLIDRDLTIDEVFMVILCMKWYGIQEDDPYLDLGYTLVKHFLYGEGADLDISRWAHRLKNEGNVRQNAEAAVRDFAMHVAKSSLNKGRIPDSHLAYITLYKIMGTNVSKSLELIHEAELGWEAIWSKRCALSKDGKKIVMRVDIDAKYTIYDRADPNANYPGDWFLYPLYTHSYDLKATWKDRSSWFVSPGKTRVEHESGWPGKDSSEGTEGR